MASGAINLETILDAFSELVAGKVAERLAGSGREGGKIRKRLLTVEDAAVYLGRTKEAVQHFDCRRQTAYRQIRSKSYPRSSGSRPMDSTK